MRLLAGWLCLSLASVWLARRMWTLRSPLTRSLYVNMTSDPGGTAAPAGGGRKETHQNKWKIQKRKVIYRLNLSPGFWSGYPHLLLGLAICCYEFKIQKNQSVPAVHMVQ